MSVEGESEVLALARRARAASFELATLTRQVKDEALLAMAAAIADCKAEILQANAVDVTNARDNGTAAELIDRLALTDARVQAMADGLRQVAGLPDPVGEVVRGSTRPNGLQLTQVRVPLGVIAIVYEARPNVTVDAAGLTVKSGNAVLLRGSGSAYASNQVLTRILAEAGAKHGLPADAIQLVPGVDRSVVADVLNARGLIDVVIPRGGAGLISYVVQNSTVPVIETGVGNVHIFVDASADLDLAERIILNSKVSRPSVCNAAESLLVHRAVAADFVPRIITALGAEGVTVHGDAEFSAAHHAVVPAGDEDWGREYLSLHIAARVIADAGEAIEHIRRWSSGHTEVIVTRDLESSRRFTAQIDAAAVVVNASSRFTDGEEFGFGAEIGISTQKLHARGPMGLTELTSTKWIVIGSGQLR